MAVSVTAPVFVWISVFCLLRRVGFSIARGVYLLGWPFLSTCFVPGTVWYRRTVRLHGDRADITADRSCDVVIRAVFAFI